MQTIEKLYTVQEIADLTTYTPDKIRRDIRRGEFGETFNNGKQHLVYESEFLAYLQRYTGPPVPYARHLGGGCPLHTVQRAPRRLTL